MEGAQRRLSRLKDEREKSKDLRPLSELTKLLAPYSLVAIAALIALIVAAGAVLVIGMGIRFLVDGGFGQGDPGALNHGLRAILIIIVVLALSAFARAYLVSWLSERVVADLRSKVYAHILQFPPNFFESMRSGEVLSRLNADSAIIQAVIGSSITQALRNMILLIGGIILLIMTNPKLTGLVLLAVPFVLVPVILLGRKVRALSRITQDRLADLGAMTSETVGGIATVQACVQEDYERERYRTLSEKVFQAATRQAKYRGMMAAIVIITVFAAISFVLWLGGHDVLAGKISAGSLASFVFYALIVASSAGALSEISGDLQRASGATERLFELLATPSPLPVQEKPVPLPQPVMGRLTFENVHFAYPSRSDEKALDHLDLTLEAGRMTAIVGPSGAGKTTLFQLILRFYDPISGKVALDGLDLTQLDPRDLRAQMGVVPQDPLIFAASVRDNIAYGKQDATDDEVRNAAKAAAADEFIQTLPDQYATYLGERGVRLSGGQRQRIAIARAILADPPILLLDEATAALDAENERFVQMAIEALSPGRTTLVIAHRLATVRNADRILVMENGQIADDGTHDSLMNTSAMYQRLSALQFSDVPSDSSSRI